MDKTAAERFEQTRWLEDSPAKVTQLEDVIRLADLTQDAETALQARDELIDAAMWSGQSEKAIVAFAAVLHAFDQKAPEERDWYVTHNVLWKYKWMLHVAQDLPSIPLERVNAMFEDFARRLLEHGYGHRVVAHKRLSFALHANDGEEAERQFKLWRGTPRDRMSDCEACEADEEVLYQLFLNDDENAIRKARPLLEGRLGCHSVPISTYAMLLQPMLRLGRTEDAMKYHLKGVKRTLKDPDFMRSAGHHLAFLALTGNLDAARRTFEKTVAFALPSHELENRFYYFGDVLTWALMLEQHGLQLVTLTAPSNFPVKPAETARNARLKKAKEFTVATLRDWVAAELESMASRFDSRLGTPVFRARIQKFRDAVQYAVQHPLENPAGTPQT
jgi:hypothetical protein